MSNSTLKVVTILGTRPEIIRLSCVMRRLDTCCEHLIVHTGQNYDYELNEVFFNDLSVRKPDYFLGVDTSSLASAIGGILIETEKVLLRENPDACLILGDTNSALAAYIARRLKIPVYHMEAGNRCFDRNVPEETNRKVVDHIADFNLVYTEHARRNLLAEGLPARRIYLTGSPMNEVLSTYLNMIDASNVLETLKLEKNNYFVVSVHREENVDNPDNLSQIVDALNMLATKYSKPIIVSTHPRTRKRLDESGESAASDLIRFLKPFGFHDYNYLQKSSLCVLSDSGTIAEESSILNFPAVTPRFSIERPEAIDTGSVMACGCDSSSILRCIEAAITQGKAEKNKSTLSHVPIDYTVSDTSQRVVNLIISTAKLSNAWDGIADSY